MPTRALEQKPRHKDHVRHVCAALAAAALHRVAEDIDHQLGVFLLPVEAVCQHAHELLLFCVQQHRVHDAATDDIRHERAAHIVHRAELEGLVDIGAARLGRDHDDRNVVDPVILVHRGQHLEAVHLRHHDVQQQHLDLAMMAPAGGDRLLSVGDLEDAEVMLQHIDQKGAVPASESSATKIFF